MKLDDTIEMMISEDYKKRFKAEHAQLLIRYDGLKNMLAKWDAGELNFKPTCPRSTYNLQLSAMETYLGILETRAVAEGIELVDITAV